MRAHCKMIFVLLLLWASVPSCTEKGMVGGASEERPVTLSLTKAGQDGTTFSAFLFDFQQKQDYSQGKSGTYYSSGTDLIPGTPGNRDISKGLVAMDGSYALSIVSPSTALSSIPGTSYYGIAYSKNQEIPMYVSTLFNISLSGIYADGQYAFDPGEMREARSMIRVTVKCGEKVNSAILHSVTGLDILTKSWYLPQIGEFYRSKAPDDYETIDFEMSGQLATGGSVTSEKDFYVVAQDYSAVDDFSQPRFVVPKLLVKLGESGNTRVTLPLNDNMTGQKIYHYTITVNSVLVSLSLEIKPWEHSTLSGDMDLQPEVPEVIQKDDWEIVEGEGMEGTIQ